MDQNAYLSLLKKARSSLPDNVHNKERWALPKPEVMAEGRMTLLRNFKGMVDATRRDADHLSKFLLSQVGTAGHVDGDRLVFTGKVSPQKIQGVLDDYVETYVRCSECGAPDTHIEKDARVNILKCEACGSRTPIKARKARRPEAAVKEGGTYQVTLTQPGKPGGKPEAKGIYEGYVFVVASGQVGQTVWARVTKMSDKMAFAEISLKPKDA